MNNENKPKLFCFFTPSHKYFFENYLKPSAENEFEINPIFHEEQLSESGEYRQDGWRETQYNKVLAWKKAVVENKGEIITCCDVDIQFLKESFSFLKNQLGDLDIMYQENDFKGKICSGFFLCKCSDKLESYLNLVAERLKGIMHQKGGGEQYVMQSILDENKIDLNWGKFDRTNVWNPGFKYSNVDELLVPDEIFVHHANWAEGNDNKMKQLDFVRGIFKEVKNVEVKENSSESLLEEYKDFSKPKSNIAVCLSSLIRHFDIGSKSLIDNVIKSFSSAPDFFGSFPVKSLTKENVELLKEILKHCNNYHIIFDQDELDRKYLSYNLNLNSHQRNGISGNLLQWKSMQKVKKIKNKSEIHFNEKYNCVIWARPDLYYFNQLEDINLLKEYDIYFPGHDNHFCGIFDRFCMGTSEAMDQRMDIYNYFIKEWYENYSQDERYLFFNKNAGVFQWNPELVLSDYMNVYLRMDYGKIGLCSGKIREGRRVRPPFWHELQGVGNLANSPCHEDNPITSVIRKIYTDYKIDENSKNQWFDIFV